MNHSLSAPNRYTACRSHKKQVANINRIADKQVIASVSPTQHVSTLYMASGASNASNASTLSRHDVKCSLNVVNGGRDSAKSKLSAQGHVPKHVTTRKACHFLRASCCPLAQHAN